jgi:serine phosphatase RsbU (regulator of sigma subunit)
MGRPLWQVSSRRWRPLTGIGAVGAVFPCVFLAAAVAVDLLVPHWAFPFSPPLLVVVPALAVATSGILGALAFTMLSALVSLLMVQLQDTLRAAGHVALPEGPHWGLLYGQLVALGVTFGASLVPGYLRSRQEQTMSLLRSVSEAVQRAILVPLPEQDGGVRAFAEYLAAADEALIGGDLYDLVDTPFGVRLIVGDVRGKGMPAVTSANNLLGAFRAIAPYSPTLPELAKRLDEIVRRHRRRAGLDIEEFTTVTLVSIPRGAPGEMLCCGHPGPLLLRSGTVTQLAATQPWPPLGLGHLTPDDPRADTIDLAVEDCLLLYTDGVTEARDDTGGFYPLLERVQDWARRRRYAHPRQLVRFLVTDLERFTRGVRGDDAAILAAQRAIPATHPRATATQRAHHPTPADGQRPAG